MSDSAPGTVAPKVPFRDNPTVTRFANLLNSKELKSQSFNRVSWGCMILANIVSNQDTMLTVGGKAEMGSRRRKRQSLFRWELHG